MISIFVDTSPLCALNCTRDQYYQRSWFILKKLQKYHHKLITTDYVISETATTLLTSAKAGYPHAVSFLDWLFKKPSPMYVELITLERFHLAIDVFRRYNKDKQWSFTDCTNYVIIKELKIDKVFTFDKHFLQMGFTILR